MPQVPLPKTSGGVSDRLEMVGQGIFLWVEPLGRAGEKHVLVHPNPLRVTSREQGCPRRSANGRCDHEAGKLTPLLGYPVDVGCVDLLGTKTTQVSIPLIVGKDEDEVWLVFRTETKREDSKEEKIKGLGIYHERRI